MVVERLFFATNLKTAMAVSEARGVLIFTLATLGIPYVEITPMQLKLKVAGSGKANKRMIQEAIVDILKLSDTPKSSEDDATDALGMAVCGARMMFEV